MALLVIAWLPNDFTILIFGLCASSTIGFIIPTLYTLTAESFPTPVRATCVAITDGLSHLGGAFCGQIIFGVYAIFQSSGHGFNAPISTIALTGLIAGLLLLFGNKMTKKQLF